MTPKHNAWNYKNTDNGNMTKMSFLIISILGHPLNFLINTPNSPYPHILLITAGSLMTELQWSKAASNSDWANGFSVF